MSSDYFNSDTIVAIATAQSSDAGVGIIRISGPQAMQSLYAVSKLKGSLKPRYAKRVYIYENNAVLDDGLVLFFKEGASFTGEEVVELQLHGGRYLLNKVVNLLVSTGYCRLALPGEFSFRAVRNGRMGLDQASAIQQLIHSKSAFELWSARQNISGARAEFFREILEKIRFILARVELSIDFIDQDVEVYSANQAREEIEQILNRLRKLKSDLEISKRVAEGPVVIFYGKPNVGKSTLFNLVLGEDRAIVSSTPGTTRDVITERVEIGPYMVKLADTAGVRNTEDSIEADGVTRTINLMDRADVRVLMLSAVDKPEDDIKQATLGRVKPHMVIVNKSDSVGKERMFEIMSVCSQVWPGVAVVQSSLLQKQGVDLILVKLKDVLDSLFGQCFQQPMPTAVQIQSIESTDRELTEALSVIDSSGVDKPEILSSILFRACRGLALLCGETDPDLVLNKIFSEFCIGK